MYEPARVEVALAYEPHLFLCDRTCKKRPRHQLPNGASAAVRDYLGSPDLGPGRLMGVVWGGGYSGGGEHWTGICVGVAERVHICHRRSELGWDEYELPSPCNGECRMRIKLSRAISAQVKELIRWRSRVRGNFQMGG